MSKTKIALSTINKVLGYSKNRETLQGALDKLENAYLYKMDGANPKHDENGDHAYVQVYVKGAKKSTRAMYDQYTGAYMGGSGPYNHPMYIPIDLLKDAIQSIMDKQAKEMEDLGVIVD